MTKWIYRIVVVILLIIALLMIRECTMVGTELTPGAKSDTTYVYIPGINDTTFIEVEKPIVVEKYHPVYLRDTVYINDTTEYYTDQYNIVYEDSLLKGILYATISTDSCTLDTIGFEYTPKFPKYITRVDTLKEKIVIQLPPQAQLLGGVEMLMGANPDIIGNLSFQTRKGMVITGGYGPLTGTIKAGIQIPLFKFK